jgi:hypothetical protein
MEKKKEQTAREVYLEERVQKLPAEVEGYKELMSSYEGILCALVKGTGGAVTIKAEDVKEAIEVKDKLMYHYDANQQTYTMTTANG